MERGKIDQAERCAPHAYDRKFDIISIINISQVRTIHIGYSRHHQGHFRC